MPDEPIFQSKASGKPPPSGLTGSLQQFLRANPPIMRIGALGSRRLGVDRLVVTGMTWVYTDAAGQPVYRATFQLPDGYIGTTDWAMSLRRHPGRRQVGWVKPSTQLTAEMPEVDWDTVEIEVPTGPDGPADDEAAAFEQLNARLATLQAPLIRMIQGGASLDDLTAFLGRFRIPADVAVQFLQKILGDDGDDGDDGSVSFDDLTDDADEDGGGGYGYGPVYTPPDEALVADGIKGMLIQLLGHADETRLGELVGLYMREHRRAFGGAAVDPAQAVKDAIRGQDAYKRIHKLRPEQVDETEWISSQAGQLLAAGVRNEAVDERAVLQAQVGTPLAQARQSANIAELQATKRALPEFFNRFSQAATASFRRVR